MDNKEQELKDSAPPKDASETLLREGKSRDITVRDDRLEFPALLDTVRRFRDRRHRFRLIDTGRFSSFELEWLAAAGADLYTSDDTRSSAQELELINASSKKGNALVALFFNGDLGEGEQGKSFSLSELMNLGRSGVYVHVSNKKAKRDLSVLAQLADNCRKGGSWLVYYHHGMLETPVVGLAQNGAWIHISDLSLADMENPSIVKDLVQSACSLGGNMVLHWEKGVPFFLLNDIVKAGAVVLFESALFDFKSPFRIFKEKAKGRKLDYRAYYLYPHVLP
jgi:hypothetical protein